jgi:hypothetical protein
MIFKWFDKYEKVNFELRLWIWEDEINLNGRYSKSEWTWWRIDSFWHSPDIEDYEPKRWSDLEFNKNYNE